MTNERVYRKAMEFCARVTDGTHDTPNEVNGGYPLITSKNIKNGKVNFDKAYTISAADYDEINKRSKVDKYDILFTMIGTVGEICIVKDEPAFAIKNIGLFKCGGDLIKAKWLYYYLSSKDAQEYIHSRGIGTTQSYITLDDLRNFPIWSPPLETQKEIARILGTLDDKIELNRRMNKTLEEIAQTLFKHWFIDFEFPNAEGKPYKSSGGAMIDSELGLIPKGWRVGTISDIAKKVGIGPFGSSIKVETFTESGIPIISGQHLRDIRLSDIEYNFVTKEHAYSLSNSLVYRGDVIFTHAGSIGQEAYIPHTSKYDVYIISQRQFYLRCDKNIMHPELVALYFKTPIGQHNLLANTSSSGVPSISQPVTNLKRLKILIPPMTVQIEFVKYLNDFDSKIAINKNEIEIYKDMLSNILKVQYSQ